MTTRAVTEGGTVTTTNTTQVPPVASLRFHVLGHMRVQVDDETQSFGSPQAQAFLAVLLFRPGGPERWPNWSTASGVTSHRTPPSPRSVPTPGSGAASSHRAARPGTY